MINSNHQSNNKRDSLSLNELVLNVALHVEE